MKLNRCWDAEAKRSEGRTATAERHPASASGASGGITKLGVFEGLGKKCWVQQGSCAASAKAEGSRGEVCYRQL